MSDKRPTRLAQFKQWAVERLRFTPRSGDSKVKRTVSAPSSPQLIRPSRLRSASAEIMATSGNDDDQTPRGEPGKEESLIQGEASNNNQEKESEVLEQLPRVVVNSEFDCSNARTRSGLNYLSRQPLRVIQPGHASRPVSSSTREHGGNIINPSGQGRENILLQMEREVSLNKSIRASMRQSIQNPYIHPLNGNFPITGTVSYQEQSIAEVGMEPMVEESDEEDGIRVRASGNGNENIQSTSQDTSTNTQYKEPSIVQVPAQQSENEKCVATLLEDAKQLVKDINYMNDHIMETSDWWEKYEEYVSPYEDRMRDIILKLAKVDVFGKVLEWTCKQDEALATLKSGYKEKAQEMIKRFACTSLLDDREIIEVDPVTGNDVSENTQQNTQGSTEAMDIVKTPDSGLNELQAGIAFNIWQDTDLEQNLSKTRCFTNLDTKVEDAKSKAEYAKSGVRDLFERMRLVEERVHKCDPELYKRLAVLELGSEIFKKTSAAKEDVANIQKEIAAYKVKGTSIESRMSGLQNKVEATHNLAKNLCNALGQEYNVLSSTSHPGPEWGSVVSSRNTSPTPDQGQGIARCTASCGGTISQITSATTTPGHSTSRQSNRQQGELPRGPVLTPKGALIANEHCNNQTQSLKRSKTHQLRVAPNDESIDLNRIQPVPVAWRNRRGSPLYTPDQIDSIQYSMSLVLKNLRQDVPIGATRNQKRLIDHCNHMITLMMNNTIESLDTTDKVKDVYSTTMNMVQTDVKELAQYQKTYESTTPTESQDETLLNTVDEVNNCAKEWMRDLQSKYRELGCGMKPLSNRHLQDIPVFDGRADMSVYEFLDRFKASVQGEGQSKDKANVLHRNYLATDIKQMTEDKKDDFDELIAALMERFGPPQIVVSNIIEAIPAENLPSFADDQRPALAAHFRRLESAYAQIANLPKYGINQEQLIEYLTTHECLESIKKRIPPHMIAELNREFRKKNLSKTLLAGMEHYGVLRSFVADMSADYDSFQETRVISSTDKRSKPKDTANKRKVTPTVAKVNQVQGEEDSDQEPVQKSVHLVDSAGQGRPGAGLKKRQNKQTRPDGSLKCPLDGDEHKAHGLPECTEFWNMSTVTKRSLLRERACYACFQPWDACKPKGCINNPPREMLCKGCLDAKSRFIPAVVLCRSEQHRSQAKPDDVLGAMQKFLGKFDGKFYKPEKILDIGVASQ